MTFENLRASKSSEEKALTFWCKLYESNLKYPSIVKHNALIFCIKSGNDKLLGKLFWVANILSYLPALHVTKFDLWFCYFVHIRGKSNLYFYLKINKWINKSKSLMFRPCLSVHTWTITVQQSYMNFYLLSDKPSCQILYRQKYKLIIILVKIIMLSYL